MSGTNGAPEADRDPEPDDDPSAGSRAPDDDGLRVVLTLEDCILPPDRLSVTPSQVHGLRPEDETDLRILGCELIQSSGILLRLPQVAMATGQVLFQRFYYSESFVRQGMEMTSMACIALASKIEEAPRRLRDVINVFVHLKQRRTGLPVTPIPLDHKYLAMKTEVIKAERRLLKVLGFCVHVKHPHKFVVSLLQVLGLTSDRQLIQSAWNYMNDSLRTDVFCRFPADTIAVSCIYLSTRILQVSPCVSCSCDPRTSQTCAQNECIRVCNRSPDDISPCNCLFLSSIL